MTGSRQRILSNIRQSLARARHLPDAPRVSLTPDPPAARTALVERFAQELALVGGVCVCEPRLEAVPERVAALARDAGAGEVLAWAADQLPLAGLHSALAADGLALVSGELPHDEPARTAATRRLETVRVGLTRADAALADTGILAMR